MSIPGPDRDKPRSEGIALGSILGVPVVLAWSWFLIAAFIVVAFGPDVARALPGIGAGSYLVAFAYAVLLMLSVLVHELAHALSAKAFGWPGARIVLTLWGGHTQFGSFTSTPGRSLAVALAGPLANFLLAGIGFAAAAFFDPQGVVGLLLDILVWANFLVALFNVLPGLPLDGGRLVESAVWRATGSQDRGTIAAGWAGRLIVVGLLAYFIVLPLSQGRALELQVAVVAAMLGAFLWMGASQSIAGAKMRMRLPSLSAGTLMVPAAGLPWTASVADVDAVRAAFPGPVLLQGPDGRPGGVVDPASLASVPEPVRGTTAAAHVSRALAPGAVVGVEASGRALIDQLAGLSATEYAVVDPSGRIVGLLEQAAVVQAVTGRR